MVEGYHSDLGSPHLNGDEQSRSRGLVENWLEIINRMGATGRICNARN